MYGSAIRLPLGLTVRRSRMRGSLAFAGLLILALMTLPTLGMAPAENAKVERLLGYLKGLQGCKFIRNGREYDGVAAEKHLRMKLQKAGDRIKDAREFIERCASESTVSGELYRIRFADGTVRPCREVLLEELERYEKNPPPRSSKNP